MAMFCRQPKEVETARGERPSGEKRVVKLSKDVVKSRFLLVLNMKSVKITCCKEQSLVAPQQRQQEFWRSPTLHLGSSAVEQNHPGQENLIVTELKTYWGENSPNHECTVPSLRNCRMYPAPNVASVLIANIDINLKTLYWETAVSQSAGLASTSEREMRISHNN